MLFFLLGSVPVLYRKGNTVQCKPCGLGPGGVQAIVAYTGKAIGQHMKQESTDELIVGNGHLLHTGIVLVILPGEGGAIVISPDDPAVANRYAMGVPAQVLECSLSPSERLLSVDDPILLVARVEQVPKGPVRQGIAVTAFVGELPFVIQCPAPGKELAPEQV